MRRRIYLKADKAHQHLNIIWLLLTIFLFSATLYYVWHKYLIESQNQLEASANTAALSLDNLIKSLLIPDFLPTIDKINSENCDKFILPFLHRINFNNLSISGLGLLDNKGQSCSTLSEEYILPIQPSKYVSLQGPYWLTGNKEPAFVLQQPRGNHYLLIYILQSVIENQLTPFLTASNFIGLYDTSTNQYIIELGQINLNKQKKDSSESINLVELKLKNLVNLKFVMKANLTWSSLFYKELPFLLGISLLSLFLYIQSKGLLKNYYSLDKAILVALKKKCFLPSYQPIYNVETKTFTGVEVLVRWQVSTTDIIMPDEFIEAAEKNGLIIPITLQLMKRVFQEAGPFLKENPEFYISFNISARHFINDAFFDKFDELCHFYSISAKQIMLELTERELLNQQDEKTMQKMNELRERGFSLAVDDFGTGHASIQYLQHFPFNYLKIDKIFIHAIGTGAITETLNDGIIHMAKKINLKIIAEGVETKEQLTFLHEKEVDFIQGFYFARPLSFSNLIKYLHERKTND